MGLRGDLAVVRDFGYLPSLGQLQPAQVQLRQVRKNVQGLLPPLGFRVKVSGAQQNLPKIAWLGILDPAVTTTAQAGLYVVYLYDVSLKHVFLTMNQGVTAHKDIARATRPVGTTIDGAAIAALTRESVAIRAELPESLLEGTSREIDLGLDEFNPAAYAAGTIAAIDYDLENLPSENALREDLDRFLLIYAEAVDALSRLTTADPNTFRTPVVNSAPPRSDRAEEFRPKDSSDYVAQVGQMTQHRTRSHEAVVEAFGRHAKSVGYRAVTNVHPRDLVLRSSGAEVLCEVKVVRANAEFAVREAIGQLITYRHFLYDADSRPLLLAVFSSAVGNAFVDLLEDLDIGSVWPIGNDQWRGSNVAATLGLAEPFER